MLVYTDKQREAVALFKTPSTNIMLYGGSRSGKTALICELILYMASKYPNSRHLIARHRWTEAKASIWLDTLPKLLKGREKYFAYKEQDHYIKCINGSEIWVDGLDDADRAERILGREYNTIYVNEISKGVAYNTITLLKTRLALKVEGLKNRMVYDCNPPSIYHWAYKVFIQKVDPITNEPLSNPEAYASILMNPIDNIANLPEGYIEENLEHLPEYARRRFLLGEFTKPEGAIFEDFEIVDEIPNIVKEKARHGYGLDFGYSIDPTACVGVYDTGKEIWLDEVLYKTRLNNADIISELQKENVSTEARIVADCAEPKSIDDIGKYYQRIMPCEKGADSVRYGIDLMLRKKIFVTRTSTNLINELQNYIWKTDLTGMKLGEPEDSNNHAIDAIRYLVTYFAKKKTWFAV